MMVIFWHNIRVTMRSLAMLTFACFPIGLALWIQVQFQAQGWLSNPVLNGVLFTAAFVGWGIHVSHSTHLLIINKRKTRFLN